GRDGETDFLVMEFVEGEELKGPLPVGKALEYATQITDALDHAHRRGVIHRDLKPANILVTKAGVKVLDFGLAKLAKPKRGVADDTEATLTKALTSEGTILGTPQYMSPEQIEGKEADARSDIFSFGAVLYELLTGKRAFDGNSPASIMAKVMAGEPEPIAQMQPLTPPGLERVVGKCLRKEPDERWQSAGDLRDELQWVATSAPEKRAKAPAFRERLAWLVAAVCLIAAVVIGVVHFSGQPAGDAGHPAMNLQ
ncbi:MAG: serine/threonine protein kinase, partial [bacterium]|nr:serine/threonine protein kinase [bacterium]